MKVFISYSWRKKEWFEWVWDRLKPVLDAGGAEVLIDRDYFKAGVELVGQMDGLVDDADVCLLVLTEGYLESESCRHEMERAIGKDPGFKGGEVVPFKIDGLYTFN